MNMRLAKEHLAALCRQHGPGLHLPAGLDGAQLLWAFSGRESSFGARSIPLQLGASAAQVCRSFFGGGQQISNKQFLRLISSLICGLADCRRRVGPAVMFSAKPETRPRTDTAAESPLNKLHLRCSRWFIAPCLPPNQRFVVCLDVGEKRS